jgi:hypothetical protein
MEPSFLPLENQGFLASNEEEMAMHQSRFYFVILIKNVRENQRKRKTAFNRAEAQPYLHTFV